MLFYIEIILLFAVPLISYLNRNEGEDYGLTARPIFEVVVPMLLTMVICMQWNQHASDLSKILAQEEVILVQEERIESLSNRLNNFDYPISQIALNADTPVASIVAALNSAESNLARARTERAKSIRSIEARRFGLISGVITVVGDYK